MQENDEAGSNSASEIATDRSWAAWDKWATRSRRPSSGLKFLRNTHRLTLYPQLAAIVDIPQDPQWHPEGDVWTHTLHVCDAAAAIAAREQLGKFDRTVLVLAALCHDFGKATHTELSNGRWHAYGHEAGGVEPTRAFLQQIGCPIAICESVTPLVANHLAHMADKITLRLVRRLAVRMEEGSIKLLAYLIEADASGRPPLPKRVPENARLIYELSKRLRIERDPPKAIVLGRHLIAMGYAPSPWFGEVLKQCFEAQLDGVFVDEEGGERFLRELVLPGNNPD